MANSSPENIICVGIIVSAHGIRGAVKIKPFTTEPLDLENYCEILLNKEGQAFPTITISGTKKDLLIAKVEGTTTRNDAETLKGTELFIMRDQLPEPEEGEFYYEDLVGLRVVSTDQADIGTVTAVHDFGAGDIIEIQLKDSDKTEMFAFTEENIPEINIPEGYLVLHLPEMEYVRDGE